MVARSKIVQQLRGGQITIPIEFRRELGIEPNSLLRVTLDEGALKVEPVHVEERRIGSPWAKELYDYFAPVREQILADGYSEEEVNADIDAAIAEVRAERG